MTTKNPTTGSNWTDPDDAPPLDRDWFDRGEVRKGNEIVRAARVGGRPKSLNPKQSVSIRLDADLLAHFRKTGPGWQSRINETLRKATGIK